MSHGAVASSVPIERTPFETMQERADFIGIVEVLSNSRAKPDAPISANNPALVAVRPLVVYKGDPSKQFRIVWLTRREEGITYPMPQVPAAGKFMVYLKKNDTPGLFGRFSDDWSLQKIPETPNVLYSRSSPLWRGTIEISPFISTVGERIVYRHYSTRLDSEPYEGTNLTMSASLLTLIDFTRKKRLFPVIPDKRTEYKDVVPHGATRVHEVELSKHFDLSRPGEYWLLTGVGPMRFEVVGKEALTATPTVPR